MKALVITIMFVAPALAGCIAVSAAATVAKTTVKAGGAVIDAGVDAVDEDDEEDRRD